MSDRVYDHPHAYATAFGWRPYQREIAIIAEAMRRHATIPCQHLLEIACGPASHCNAVRTMGWRYTGFDSHPPMVEAAQTAAGDDPNCTIHTADLRAFDLPGVTADVAICLLGSLYVDSAESFHRHLAHVASHLSPGGLYLMDWVVHFEPPEDHLDEWSIGSADYQIDAIYRTEVLNRAEQTIREHLELTVSENESTRILSETQDQRAFYPQEFRLLVDANPHFEFVGWWNDWDLDHPIAGAEPVSRPLIALRRL